MSMNSREYTCNDNQGIWELGPSTSDPLLCKYSTEELLNILLEREIEYWSRVKFARPNNKTIYKDFYKNIMKAVNKNLD